MGVRLYYYGKISNELMMHIFFEKKQSEIRGEECGLQLETQTIQTELQKHAAETRSI
jgi:hypothetical protein